MVEIHPLMVAESYQRKGLGRQMVSYVKAWAQQRGALILLAGAGGQTCATSLSGVDLYENFGKAIANFHQLAPHPCGFWLKLGFSIVGVVPDAEGRAKPSFMMAKPLGVSKGGPSAD